jgi:hypothetical protein
MPKRRDWAFVYLQCQVLGVSSVARALGMSYQQLVADLAREGVSGAPRMPTQKEIRNQCEKVQKSWSEERRAARWGKPRTPAAG